MANYYCVIRTNYFHVKNETAFKEFMARVEGTEEAISLWEEKDSHGQTVFGFGVYGAISGVRNSDDDEDMDETAYDEFIDGLQEFVAEDDAIIIMEAGHENLRYVIGSATIVTSKSYKHINITDRAKEAAADMLGNPQWDTTCSY